MPSIHHPWNQIGLLLAVVFTALLAGCGDGENASDGSRVERDANPKGNAMSSDWTIAVTSPAFSEGERIPDVFTAEGKDVSPPLAWSGTPRETVQYAIICDDPDAPSPTPWVHWLVWGIPGDVHELSEAVPSTPQLVLLPGAGQGRNSFSTGRTTGYRGPAPPPGHGEHRYFFTVFALDASIDVPPGADRATLEAAMQGHVVAKGRLMGMYSR